MMPGRVQPNEVEMAQNLHDPPCNTVLLGLGARRESLGHLVHAPVTEEAGRLRPQWGLSFEGRARGRGVQRRDSPVGTQVRRNPRETAWLTRAPAASVPAQAAGGALR